MVETVAALKAGGRNSMLLALQTRLLNNVATKPYMSASMSRSLAIELMAVLDRDALRANCIDSGKYTLNSPKLLVPTTWAHVLSHYDSSCLRVRFCSSER